MITVWSLYIPCVVKGTTVTATSQKNFRFLHEKTKFIVAMKNSKFFVLSTQSKDNVTLKFNEFKQDAASFNFMC